jgi:hypothetical protein
VLRLIYDILLKVSISFRPTRVAAGLWDWKISMVMAVHQDKIIAWQFFERTRTDSAAVTKERWVTFLNTTLRQALEDRNVRQPILLFDNAKSHSSFHSMDFYLEVSCEGWDLLPQAEYSPDTNPLDFDVFNRIKRRLRGHRFNTKQELKNRTEEIIRELNEDTGQHRMKGNIYLPIRWGHIIKAKGEYIH